MQSRILGLRIANEANEAEDSDQEAREIVRDQNFSAFTDLEELAIYNIYDDPYRWRRHLVKILKNSPRLCKLGLSISAETIARFHLRGHHEAYTDFFDHFCNEYGRSAASPLQLQSLKCGTGIWPKSAASLRKLTDLFYLQEVHIENESVQGDGGIYLYLYDDDEEESGIVFDTLLSYACPNLRRFTANQLQGDVYKALCSNTDVAWTSQLALSFENPNESGYEVAQILTEDSEYPGLPMQLRMIDLDLKNSTRDETKTTLDNLVSSNYKTLEGLAIYLPQNHHGEIGHLDLLQKTILQMQEITQISINRQNCHGNGSCAVESLYATSAEKLANAQPRLQCINICWSFWRISRCIDAEGKVIVNLELMDEWERKDVELFQDTI